VTVQVFRARDRAPTPWKNGGGVTREIAAFPAGADLDTFDWRVSMASVTGGGPFSIFPCVDRVLSVLHGELILRFDGGRTLMLTADSQPAIFPGDVAIGAQVGSGPVTDLNVMTRRGRIRAHVRRLRAPPSTTLTAGETTLILSFSPRIRVLHGGVSHGLERYDGMLFQAAAGDAIDLDAGHPADIFQIDFRR